jgi:hypothetical protein
MKQPPKKLPHGDRYKYREGQRSLTVFVDKHDLDDFTVLCVRVGTDKTTAVRSYLKACIRTGKL